MNLSLERTWHMRGNVIRWWNALAASVSGGRRVLGAYLGGEGLTLVQVSRGLSGIQVERWAVLPFSSGKMEMLEPALKETVLAWTLESCPVSLAVSPHQGFSRQVSLPLAASENLAQVVTYELDRFLPLAADDLFYGFQVLGETATEIRLMVMAMPRNQVEVCLRLLTEATLRPVALEMAPMAAGKVFTLSDRSLTPSWLLLHLESASFELAHFHGDRMQAFVQDRNLGGQELFRATLAQIDKMASEPPNPRVLCIYGGGGTEFKVGALKQHELEVIYPSHLAIPGLQPDMNLDEVLPAVGAGLSCLGQAPLGVNLLPPAERAAVRMGRVASTTALLLVFLVLGCLWGASAFVHTRVELYRVNRQIAALSQEAKNVEKLLQESQALAKQMESLRTIGQSPNKLKVLKDLTQLIPDNTWLSSLQLSKQYVNLAGTSTAASELIPLLDKSGLLKKTEFASPTVTDASKLEHFKIKAEF
jgi:Tfp pilus assembly protein PilN